MGARIFCFLFSATAAFGLCASDIDIDPAQCYHQKKPNIESYSDYNAFMVDIIHFKKVQRACQRMAKAGTLPPPPEKKKPTDPQAERIVINPQTGREDIVTAVEKAKTFDHPAYKEKLRYNRTTSQSFALPKLRNTNLSEASLPGALHDPAAGEPESFDEVADRELETMAVEQTLEETAEQKTAPACPNGQSGSCASGDPATVVYIDGVFIDSSGARSNMRPDGSKEGLIVNSVNFR